MPFASSTVITPSLPTFSIASAMISPISFSLLAAIVATSDICLFSVIGVDCLLISSTTFFTVLSMPLFTSIAFAPAVMLLKPSLKIARAITVAVVVPSPAASDVLAATSRTSCAPMFS